MEKIEIRLPYGDLRPSDLPDFCGVEPTYIDEVIGKEDKTLRFHVRCNIYRSCSKAEGTIIANHKTLVLAFDQFLEFEEALFSSENAMVLLDQTGKSLEFKTGSGFSSGRQYNVIHLPERTFWQKVRHLPTELAEVIELLRDIAENGRTVKNRIELKYDRSRVSTLNHELQSVNGKLIDALDRASRSEYSENAFRNRIIASYKESELLEKADKNLIRELQFQLSTREEDVLREAEKIKARIAAQQNKEVNQ